MENDGDFAILKEAIFSRESSMERGSEARGYPRSNLHGRENSEY